jgi:hypothetical protein
MFVAFPHVLLRLVSRRRCSFAEHLVFISPDDSEAYPLELKCDLYHSLSVKLVRISVDFCIEKRKWRGVIVLPSVWLLTECICLY